MVKETIKYVDYDGNEREEDFYFNLTEAEIVELDYSSTGGLEKVVKAIYDAQDKTRIISLFKKIILMSYGRKSLDGRRFEKSEEITNDFVSTQAYSILFMKLASNHEEAAKFINSVVEKPNKVNSLPQMPQTSLNK